MVLQSGLCRTWSPVFSQQGSFQLNDGPLCRCSLKHRKKGIRHSVYPGEQVNNLCSLYTSVHAIMAVFGFCNLVKNPSHEYIRLISLLYNIKSSPVGLGFIFAHFRANAFIKVLKYE